MNAKILDLVLLNDDQLLQNGQWPSETTEKISHFGHW